MKLLIRYWRVRKGLTLTELAKRSFISKSFLSKLENNKGLCNLETLKNIAYALEICPRNLIHCGADIPCNLFSNCSSCPYR